MTHVRVKIFLAILLLASVVACRSELQAEGAPHGSQAHSEFLDVHTFHTNDTVQNRILNLSFQEAGARLNSLVFEAQSTMTFRRAEEILEQEDRFEARQDALGNQRVTLSTPEHSITIQRHGSTLYVTQDKGKTREKPARGLELHQWGEMAFSSLAHALAPFRPHLVFLDPSTLKLDGRDCLRFNLELNTEPVEKPLAIIPSNSRPVRVPSLWRELSRPTDIQGHLVIDQETGVILRSEITGKLEISDRDVHPTQLVLHYQSGLTRVGHSDPLEKPRRSSPEIRRDAPISKPLHFFRKQLKEQANLMEQEDQKK